MTAQALAEALGAARKTGKHWRAKCPGHNDHTPSLYITEDGGKVLFNCQVGCSQSTVTDALVQQGLWSLVTNGNGNGGKSQLIAEYRYCDADGTVVFRKLRKQSAEGKRYFVLERPLDGGWQKGIEGIPRVLYNLHAVLKAVTEGRTIFFVEGEKDADRLNSLGLVATTHFQGARTEDPHWLPEYTQWLTGARVVVLIDNDVPGLNNGETAATYITGAGGHVRLILLPGLKPKGDVSDWLDAGHTKDELLEIVKTTPLWTAFAPSPQVAQPEPAPVEHTQETGKPRFQDPSNWGEWFQLVPEDIPPLTVDVLPEPVNQYAKALSAYTETPGEFAVMMILSALATCLQKKIEVTPRVGDYLEPVSLWTATVMDPGSRKSAVYEAVAAPIKLWEAEKIKELEPLHERQKVQRRIAKAREAALIKKAGTEKDPVKLGFIQDDITAIRQKMPKEPVEFKLQVTDATPEQLQVLLEEQGERLAILSDEGVELDHMLGGLYGKGVNLDVFLQGHAGTGSGTNRIGRRSVNLKRPALTMGMAIQELYLDKIRSRTGEHFRRRGAFARFLWCVPRSNIGDRKEATRPLMPPNLVESYKEVITKLLDIEVPEAPHVFNLTAEGHEAWAAFKDLIEQQQKPDGPLREVQGWASKLAGAALRIAAIFQATDAGITTSIVTMENLQAALQLCTYLIPHAVRAWGTGVEEAVVTDATRAENWILASAKQDDAGAYWFTERELRRSRFQRVSVETVRKALSELTRNGVISGPRDNGSGKQVWYVTPGYVEARRS